MYDVSNPANVRLAGSLDDTAHTMLSAAYVDTFLGPDGHTYALAAAQDDEDGLQVLRLDADGMDDEPPIFLDASYRYDGLATITFGEPLNSAINYSRMHIRDAGQDADGVSLDSSTNRTVSGGTVTVILDQSSREAVEKMALPQLDIEPGAVADILGNPIRAVRDGDIELVQFSITRMSSTPTVFNSYVYTHGGHTYMAGFQYDIRPIDNVAHLLIHRISDPANPVLVGNHTAWDDVRH